MKRKPSKLEYETKFWSVIYAFRDNVLEIIMLTTQEFHGSIVQSRTDVTGVTLVATCTMVVEHQPGLRTTKVT